MDKVKRQIYIDKELAEKIQDLANKESISFNKAIELLLNSIDFKNFQENWF